MNLFCRLFGHKYVFTKKVSDGSFYGNYVPVKTDYCVRCGHTPISDNRKVKNIVHFRQDMNSGASR